MANKKKFLSKEQIVAAQGKTLSNMAAARYLHVSYQHYKKYAKMYNLFEFTVKFVKSHLKPGGTFLVKVFQGVNISAVRGTMCEMFNDLTTRKPKASKDRSSEVYFLGREFVWRNSS